MTAGPLPHVVTRIGPSARPEWSRPCACAIYGPRASRVDEERAVLQQIQRMRWRARLLATPGRDGDAP